MSDFEFDLPPPPPYERSTIAANEMKLTLPPPPPAVPRKPPRKNPNAEMPPVPSRQVSSAEKTSMLARNQMLFRVSNTPIQSPKPDLPVRNLGQPPPPARMATSMSDLKPQSPTSPTKPTPQSNPIDLPPAPPRQVSNLNTQTPPRSPPKSNPSDLPPPPARETRKQSELELQNHSLPKKPTAINNQINLPPPPPRETVSELNLEPLAPPRPTTEQTVQHPRFPFVDNPNKTQTQRSDFFSALTGTPSLVQPNDQAQLDAVNRQNDHHSKAESSLADFFKPLSELSKNDAMDLNSEAPPVYPKVKKRSLPELPKFSKHDAKIYGYLNQARVDPKSMIPHLEKRLTQFESGTNNLIVSETMRLVTSEGPKAVEEAIEFLEKAEPSSRVEWHNTLGKICKDHVEDIGGSGTFSNVMSNGNYPSKLALEGMKGKISQAAESISFNKQSAFSTVLNFIIDDGLPSRGNRSHIFGQWDMFACYTGEHSASKSMTTFLYVMSSSGSSTLIKDLLAQVNRSTEDPPNWRQKKQKILYTGDSITVTNTFIMQDGTEKVVEIKRDVKDNEII